MFESRVEPMSNQKPSQQLTASWDAATSRRDKVSHTYIVINLSQIVEFH